MPFVFIYVAFNVLKGACSKKISRSVETLGENINISIFRSLICVILGFGIFLASGNGLSMSGTGFLICASAGVMTALSYIVWICALRTDAYVLASASNNSSFILVCLFGLLFFNESFSVFKGLATLLILLAIYFMVRYQTNKISRLCAKDYLVLFLVFLTNGLSLATQKWFTYTLPDTPKSLFTLYSFIFGLAFLFLMRPLFKTEKSARVQITGIKKLIPILIPIGIAQYASVYFQTLASASLDAVVLYPVSSALSLVGGTLMAWAVFKEKPTRDTVIGIILLFSALVLSKY